MGWWNIHWRLHKLFRNQTKNGKYNYGNLRKTFRSSTNINRCLIVNDFYNKTWEIRWKLWVSDFQRICPPWEQIQVTVGDKRSRSYFADSSYSYAPRRIWKILSTGAAFPDRGLGPPAPHLAPLLLDKHYATLYADCLVVCHFNSKTNMTLLSSSDWDSNA